MIPEFSRPLQLADIGGGQPPVAIAADETERAALAERFALLSLDMLEGDLSVSREGDVLTVAGTVRAKLAQPCVVTARPVIETVVAPVALRLVPERIVGAEEEIELADEELDTIEHDGRIIDLGEIAAQTMALALDPFPRAKGAREVLREAGVVSEDEVVSGPFAALAALKKT